MDRLNERERHIIYPCLEKERRERVHSIIFHYWKDRHIITVVTHNDALGLVQPTKSYNDDCHRLMTKRSGECVRPMTYETITHGRRCLHGLHIIDDEK